MPPQTPFIYLASTSARRKELLKEMGVRFRVVKSSYQEKKPKGKVTPSHLVLQHAIGKAVGADMPRTSKWLLGADTIVVLGEKILEKPKSRKEAKTMLKSLSGRSHKVLTGVCFLQPRSQEVYYDFATTKVKMKRFSRELIETYHDEVFPLDKAGAYAIQEGPKIVEKIEGSYSNVVGLPKELVRKILRKIGT